MSPHVLSQCGSQVTQVVCLKTPANNLPIAPPRMDTQEILKILTHSSVIHLVMHALKSSS